MEKASPKYYPICADLNRRRCLVVGAGKVAARKVRSLLETGALVRVVSPDAVEEVAELAGEGKIDWQKRTFAKSDLEGVFLVVGAAGDPEVNRQVYEAADSASILINIADEPGLCNFILPSVIRRGEFQIAISSGGASPVLARKIREVLEHRFGPHYGELVEELSRIREGLKERLPDESKRRQFWEQLIDLDFFDSLSVDEIHAKVRERAEECLSRLAD